MRLAMRAAILAAVLVWLSGDPGAFAWSVPQSVVRPAGTGAPATLTQEDCSFYLVGGRTAVCHATGSPSRPFVLLHLSHQACAAHAAHAADFVAPAESCE